MPVARRMVALLAFGAPFILLSPRPVSIHSQQTSQSAAHAQGASAPSRIELYLPPPRITPPAPLPVRPAPAPAAPTRPAPSLWDRFAAQVHEAGRSSGRRRARPGLFTAARIGRRLLYRKGYLGDVPVHLVVADLNDPEIKVGVMVARGGIGSTERFERMIERARPAAAITGTFFGLSNGLPTGDLVVNGHAIYQGFVGTAIAFTEGNVVSFIPTGYKEKTSWRFFNGVMRAGPLLVQSGRIAVGPRGEGFVSLSPSARRSRTAVGITRHQMLLLLAVKEPISLWQLGRLMRSLGAYHAVALDGGSSTGLYFHGQVVARPGRALTNALVIYADRHGYEQAKSSFTGRPLPGPAARPDRPQPLVIKLEPAPASQPAETPPAADSSLPVDAAPPTLPAIPASASATRSARPEAPSLPAAGMSEAAPPAPGAPLPGAAGETKTGDDRRTRPVDDKPGAPPPVKQG